MKRRLLCFSVINSIRCKYGNNCTYAHSLEEQEVDPERWDSYRTILAHDLSEIDGDTYQNLLPYANLCDGCSKSCCTGGYNCRNGSCCKSFKLCKNDFLTGGCVNELIVISFSDELKEKFRIADNIYLGCDNGLHLTERSMIPYNRYLYQKDDKDEHRSCRYIPAINYRNERYSNTHVISPDSDSSTDSELEELLRDVK